MRISPDAATQPLIAVADDDASFLRSVGRLLSLAGYTVATFATATELLAALPNAAPRCLLLDVHMPGIPGLEVPELLAAGGICVPVVYMTAYDTPQTRERARQAGSFGLLVKPFDRQDLLDAVAEAVRCSNYGPGVTIGH